MVTLIHGNDTASSRKFFISVQQKASNPVLLDGGSFTLSDLSALLQTSGLFSETKYIFIDQPFRKKQKDQIKELISLLVNNSLEHEIYLWENKEVERAIQAVS